MYDGDDVVGVLPSMVMKIVAAAGASIAIWIGLVCVPAATLKTGAGVVFAESS